jgi:lysine 6-dehydrogenase
MKVLLLGVGMQGKAALDDLAHHPAVTEIIAADQHIEALTRYAAVQQYGPKVRCVPLDATDPAGLSALLAQKPDVAIDLLPVPLVGAVAEAAVEQGVHLVNTNYTDAAVQNLAERAETQGVTILPEFGLDPGIDLVLLGEAARTFEQIDSIISYGAGFPEPQAANNPLKYKVSWTFEGVLRTYRRPARLIKDGDEVNIDASRLFAPEQIHHLDLPGLGRFEAIPNGNALKYAGILNLNPADLQTLSRYSLRWPGHCAFWKTMVDLHLLDDEPVLVDGIAVDRRRFLATALEPHLQYQKDERDVVVVRIEVSGIKDGKKARTVYQVIDRRNLQTGFTAMSRTVGYTAAIGALMIGTGQITRRGLLSPVTDVPYLVFKNELLKRGIQAMAEFSVWE